MLRQIRQILIDQLWDDYRHRTPEVQLIEKNLAQQNINKLVLDHFAIIDLPGPYSGIPYLSKLFSLLAYDSQGRDYLPSKQNDFAWLAENNYLNSLAVDAQPIVVVADFRLDELPENVRKIILKYSQ